MGLEEVAQTSIGEGMGVTEGGRFSDFLPDLSMWESIIKLDYTTSYYIFELLT